MKILNESLISLAVGRIDVKYALLQDTTASLCFRAQRIFLQNASGWFGSVPLEASGDFGIEPEEGEFHLMFQVIFAKLHDLTLVVGVFNA